MPGLVPIDTDIWMADGPEVSFFGIPYPTRMVVVRLSDGLWVWSPIELTPPLRDAIDALGEVRWLVEPNKLHHLFLAEWLSRYPTAAAWAAPGLARKRGDISFQGDLSEGAPQEWGGDIDVVVVGGSAVMDEVLFFHRPSSTCIVGDLIQRHDPEPMAAWQRAVMKLDALTGPDGSTPREWRATFLHRDAARAALTKALAWKPRRLVIAHGECAMEDGARVLSESLAWIEKPWPT